MRGPRLELESPHWQDSVTGDINVILKFINERVGPSSCSQLHSFFWRVEEFFKRFAKRF